jgi:hypothetical protein
LFVYLACDPSSSIAHTKNFDVSFFLFSHNNSMSSFLLFTCNFLFGLVLIPHIACNVPAALRSGGDSLMLGRTAHLQIRTNFCGSTPRLTQNRSVAIRCVLHILY